MYVAALSLASSLRARGELLPGRVLEAGGQARRGLDGRVPRCQQGLGEEPRGLLDVQRIPARGGHAEPHDLPRGECGNERKVD